MSKSKDNRIVTGFVRGSGCSTLDNNMKILTIKEFLLNNVHI